MERRQESLWDVITDVTLEVGAFKRVVVADVAALNKCAQEAQVITVC